MRTKDAEWVALAILVGFGLAGGKPDDELLDFALSQVAESAHRSLAGFDDGGPSINDAAL